MLADEVNKHDKIGFLSRDLHKPRTFVRELLGFIANQLPQWRDRDDRPIVTSETALTSQLCAHLNSAARHSSGWDLLQFRVEETDEVKRGRKIDLVPSPAGTAIWIAGRRHTDFDIIIPIECKRLPIPSGSNRDLREYVFSQHSSTGGIQRFKTGDHGAAHSNGAMIAYIQEKDAAHWYAKVTAWIRELAETATGWSISDLPQIDHDDRQLGMMALHSTHERQGGLPGIALNHLWLEMSECSV